jgi:hypothetical protein
MVNQKCNNYKIKWFHHLWIWIIILYNVLNVKANMILLKEEYQMHPNLIKVEKNYKKYIKNIILKIGFYVWVVRHNSVKVVKYSHIISGKLVKKKKLVEVRSTYLLLY